MNFWFMQPWKYKYTNLFIFAFMITVFIWVHHKIEAVPNTTLMYTIVTSVQTGGVHSASQTVYCTVMRNSDGYWFDFSSQTFKASGWTTDFGTMTEVTANSKVKFYKYDWTLPSGESVNEIYIMGAMSPDGIRMLDIRKVSFEQISLIAGP